MERHCRSYILVGHYFPCCTGSCQGTGTSGFKEKVLGPRPEGGRARRAARSREQEEGVAARGDESDRDEGEGQSRQEHPGTIPIFALLQLRGYISAGVANLRYLCPRIVQSRRSYRRLLLPKQGMRMKCIRSISQAVVFPLRHCPEGSTFKSCILPSVSGCA